MTARTKYFSGNLPAHLLELDEHGIPAIAYDNTEGDHPVSAIALPHIFGYEVVYEPDEVGNEELSTQR